MLHYGRSEFSPPLAPSSPLIIFGCNGVLVDGEQIVSEVAADAFTSAGFPIGAAEFLASFKGWRIEEVCRNCEMLTGRRMPPRFSTTINNQLRRRLESDLQPMRHIQHALTWLNQRRCVATNWPSDFLHAIFDRLGLNCFFDDRDMISAPRLAWADLLRQAASGKGAEPTDCVVIEHSPVAVASAVALGMRVIGFVGGRHAEESLATQLMRAGATMVIRDMRQLKAATTTLVEQRENA